MERLYSGCLIFLVCLSTMSHGQTVILYEDFEGAITGWSRSVTTGNPDDNEWHILSGVTGIFGTGTTLFGISDDGANYNYDITEPSDAAAWAAPSWPVGATNYDIEIQFDLRVRGEDFVVANIDFFSVYLVDPGVAVPVDANINGSNSEEVYEVNLLSGWNRVSLTLTNIDKTFIDSYASDVKLVFLWENDGSFGQQPPAAFDNLIVTATPTTAPPLSGDYTIGRVTGNDFGTITEAVGYINANGIDDNVNLHLTDEEYDRRFETFPFEIGDGTTSPFPGAGTFAITVKPDPVTNPTPTVTKDINLFGGDLDNHGVFTIWGLSNFAIDGSNTIGGTTRDMTIIDNSPGSPTNAPMAVYIAGISESTSQDDITIKNLNLATSSQTYGYGIVAGQHLVALAGHFADEALFDNIVLSNNAISSVREGIHVDGADRSLGTYTTNSLVTNLLIEDNEMQGTGAGAIQERGIHLLGVDGGTIAQNTIGNFDQTDLNSDAGIIIDQLTKNIVVEKNEIFNLGFDGNTTSSLSAHGMEIYNGVPNSNTVIRNNVIREIGGNGASSYANAGFLNPVAMFMGQGGEVGVAALRPQSGFEIYNNSIYMLGDEMDFPTSVSMALTLASNVTDVTFKNNLIENSLGADNTFVGKASALAIFAETSETQFDELNYNGYFINANTTNTNNYVGLVGSISSILGASSDMDSWRTMSAQEESSLFGDPGFTSTTDLLPDNSSIFSWIAHDTAEPLATVSEDFNGTTRPTTVTQGNPDLGAFEFENDPVTNPPPSLFFPGPLATETPYNFNVYQREWGSLTFNTDSDLPDDFTFTYFNGIWPADESTYNVANGYYELDPTENANTDYDYNLTIAYDEAYLGTMGSESPGMLVANDPLKSDNWTTLPTTNNTTNNTSRVFNASTFGRMAQSNEDKPLPVNLIYFKGEANSKGNILSWGTATEINNRRFIVQHSSKWEDWVSVGEVKGHGTTSEVHHYNFVDDARSSISTHYYRLAQEDMDGKINYSKIISVANDLLILDVKVRPIPAKDFLTISCNDISNEKLNQVTITNNQGLVFFADKIDNNVQINVSEWQRGLYIVSVTSGTEQAIKKIIIE